MKRKLVATLADTIYLAIGLLGVYCIFMMIQLEDRRSIQLCAAVTFVSLIISGAWFDSKFRIRLRGVAPSEKIEFITPEDDESELTMMHKVKIVIDYKGGVCVPDGKAVEWASKVVENALTRDEPVQHSAGSNIMLRALCAECKQRKLPSGFAQLYYIDGGLLTFIDEDGNYNEVPNTSDSRVLETLLMKLF